MDYLFRLFVYTYLTLHNKLFKYKRIYSDRLFLLSSTNYWIFLRFDLSYNFQFHFSHIANETELKAKNLL
jgi:hypothetical protein